MDALVRAKRPALIVAHPDDESLWFAGLVLRYPKDWLIVCCTVPYADPERLDGFIRACDFLDAELCMLGHPERAGPIPLEDFSECDLIVTHGPNGEYGHVQHKELHTRLTSEYRNVVWSGYGGTADFTLDLTDSEWEGKLAALRCYDHVSPTDRRPKWEALLDYYGKKFNLRKEPYGLSDAIKNGSQAQGHSTAGSEGQGGS